jgi:hypothetical protein
VIVPTGPVFAVFNDLVQPLYDRILANKRAALTLSKTLDLLLPKLMSGEVNVREAKTDSGAAL